VICCLGTGQILKPLKPESLDTGLSGFFIFVSSTSELFNRSKLQRAHKDITDGGLRRSRESYSLSHEAEGNVNVISVVSVSAPSTAAGSASMRAGMVQVSLPRRWLKR
jgi:hypothetical protein